MTVRTAPGEVEVKEIRTRIEQSGKKSEDPDARPTMWEYVESLTDADWASGGYRFTVERGRPDMKSEDRIYIGDFFEKLTPQEISRRWGGGDYTLWFKIPPGGRQLRDKKLLRIDGAPNTSTVGASASSNGHTQASNDPLTQLIAIMDRRLAQMETKLDVATGSGASTTAVQNAVALTGKVFEAATTAATGTLSHLAGNKSQEDDLDKEFRRAMIQRMLNPPDEIAKFAAMLSALKGLDFGKGGTSNVAAQIALEGLRALPVAITEGVKGLEHWHLARESEARILALQRGAAPIDVRPTPAAPAPPPVNNAAAAPATNNAAATAPAEPPVQVDIRLIEMALTRILTNQSYTIEEAAHRAAAMMEDLVPGMPDNVASSGEAAILNLFQTRPILMQVPQNPRLTEFIAKFIEVVKTAPVMTTTTPPNVPPA